MSLPDPPKLVPKPYNEPLRTKTSPEMKAAKKNSRNWKAIGAFVSSLLAGGAGIGAYHTANAQEKLVRLDEQQKTIKRDVQVLTERQDAGEKEVRELTRKVDKLDVKLELLLDANHVPQSKRPKE